MKRKKIAAILISCVMSTQLFGCVKPYQKPILETVETNESAFLIPLVGDSTGQSAFGSEDLLRENMVATKRVEIPTKWVKTGRFSNSGDYLPTMKLIKVDRTPVTREWTEGAGDGTSNANQGITAESVESIAFMSRMSATASIEETNAPKFLYYYNTKSLAEVMDTEIRTMVEGTFNEECGKRTVNEILENKEEIMNVVREKVKGTFEPMGITIGQINLKGEFTYLDASIQESINAEFTAQKQADAQAIENQMNIDKAIADAQVIREQESTLDLQIKLKEVEAKILEAEARKAHGWIEITGAGSVIVDNK